LNKATKDADVIKQSVWFQLLIIFK